MLDRHYGSFEFLTLAIADVLARQVEGLPCKCLQIDEANIPGRRRPQRRAPLLRQLLRADDSEGRVERARELHADQLVLEMAHRPPADLGALRDVEPRLRIGLGRV